MHLIELKNVAKYYKSEDNVSVGMKNISTTFDYNEFVAITGTSGSGKTTLLNVISGLDGYEEGEVYLNGEETSHYTIADWERYRAAYVGFVFQNYNIIDSFTVYQNVMLALDIQNYPRKERKKRALELIDKVGLTSHKNHKAAKLSGGQKQRTVIARALAKDCPIIVADEPTGNLDSETGKQILELLHEISKDKLVVVVTHTYSQVEPYATRRIRMHDGIIIEDKKFRETPEVEDANLVEPQKMTFLAIVRFAFKNLFSQPKRFLFILILQFLVVGAITFVYTSQIRSIRETGMAYSDVFKYAPETRVLVQRRDGNDMTEADLDYLSNIREVKEIYERGENFFTYESNLYLTQQNNYFSPRVSFFDAASQVNSRFIKGNIAKAENEIMISQNIGFSVGDNVILSVDRYYDEINDDEDKFEINFKITGLVGNNNSTVYLSDEFLNKDHGFEQSVNYDFKGRVEEDLKYYYNYLVTFDSENSHGLDIPLNGDLDSVEFDSDIVYAAISKTDDDGYPLKKLEVKFTAWNYDNFVSQEVTHTVLIDAYVRTNPNYDTNNYRGILIFDEELFNEIKESIHTEFEPDFYNDVIKNVTLSVNGRASGNRVLNRIDNEVYRVFYPANIKEAIRPVLVFLQTIVAILVIGLVGTFLYTILHAVSKNVMSARQKDFAIYRSIGANRKDLGKLVIVEQVILSLLALVIVILIFNILAFNILQIAAVVDYLTFSDYILLFIIFTIFGIMLGTRFNRKVFKQTVVETLSLAREDVLWLN